MLERVPADPAQPSVHHKLLILWGLRRKREIETLLFDEWLVRDLSEERAPPRLRPLYTQPLESKHTPVNSKASSRGRLHITPNWNDVQTCIITC
jgi:hypothetical protein